VAVSPPSRAKVAFWTKTLSPYFEPDTRRSIRQLLISAFAFVGFWFLAYWALAVGYWLTLVFSIPAAGFLMRLFMIQHDCGHGSYFRSRRARDLVGFAIGVLTLTPYDYWRKTHAYHHAHSGDLDLRGFGDIDTLTVAEYAALSWYRRLGYRIYRHPLVLFGIGAVFHFVVVHRLPLATPRSWTRAWRSVWMTNLALVVIVTVMSLTIGLKSFLLVQIPITTFACGMGVWLFYVQHQFEDTYWHRHEEWDYYEAALEGSSHLVLPRPIQWLTAHIGLHHVHHLSARIPNYRLEEALNAIPELQRATRIRVRDTLALMRLTLWDEVEERLVRVKDAKRLLRNRRLART
jgi:omega-6 fatty acid desaturase (delta-12 desaturase)